MQHVSPAPPTERPLADVQRLVTAFVLADEDGHGAAQQDEEAEEREARSSLYACRLQLTVTGNVNHRQAAHRHKTIAQTA